MKQRLHSCHLSLRLLQSCAIASSYKAMNTWMIFPYDCNYCAREVYRSAYIVLNGSCISHRFDHLPQYSQHACIIHVQSYRQSFVKHINYQFSQTHWFSRMHPTSIQPSDPTQHVHEYHSAWISNKCCTTLDERLYCIHSAMVVMLHRQRIVAPIFQLYSVPGRCAKNLQFVIQRCVHALLWQQIQQGIDWCALHLVLLGYI